MKTLTCPNCGGEETSVEGGPCPACKGTGRVPDERKPPRKPYKWQRDGSYWETVERIGITPDVFVYYDGHSNCWYAKHRTSAMSSRFSSAQDAMDYFDRLGDR